MMDLYVTLLLMRTGMLIGWWPCADMCVNDRPLLRVLDEWLRSWCCSQVMAKVRS